jgi:hypothetical protein
MKSNKNDNSRGVGERIGREQALYGLSLRVAQLQPGDCITAAFGSLLIGRVEAVSILYVPSGNYVWVVNGVTREVVKPGRASVGSPLVYVESKPSIISAIVGKNKKLGAFKVRGIASDVVPKFELPFELAEDTLCDWKTFMTIKTKLTFEGKMKEASADLTEKYISEMARSACGGANILDFEFRITSDFFKDPKNNWYSRIIQLVLVIALLEGKMNYDIPLEEDLTALGPEKATQILSSLRTELLGIQMSVRSGV